MAKAKKRHPCKNGIGTKKSKLMGRSIQVTPVTDISTPEQLILECMPAFGGAYVRRIYSILDKAIGRGVPLIISVSGPLTASNQHRAWFIPLLETGWVAYITTTDAVCYHDGHDLLQAFAERPLYEVPIEGADEKLREEGVIRITDIGFSEKILYDQDKFITAMLCQPEFQRKMTGTEFRYLLGKYYAAQEQAFKIKPGLISTCYRNAIPVFVGAPGDGSNFLNSVKLWALRKLKEINYKFDIDIHEEVFESCAYHYWGLKQSATKQLAILILGGGVPKNFSLQPEPTLSQIFMLPNINGYDYDVQIVGAPVTDGSLTSCKGQEAHTWGKVSKEALESTVESFQTDYSTVMPLIAWALLDKRQRFLKMQKQLGEEKLYKRHPEARGYIRADGQLRLFGQRKKLMANLLKEIGKPASLKRLEKTMRFTLQLPKTKKT
ncbi:MAG: deoxyhypusine synthase family protein [Patescibacteria group bacterium]